MAPAFAPLALAFVAFVTLPVVALVWRASESGELERLVFFISEIERLF